MSHLKIISLNIEGLKHLDIQENFYLEHLPHVICLQEIFEDTYIYLKNKYKLNGLFAPMWKRPIIQNDPTSFAVMGVALLTNCEVEKINAFYYNGSLEAVYDFIPGITSQDLVSRAIIIANISHDGKKYTIGTTHFTWSENGLASTQQRRDIKSLFEIIDKHPEIVFCGDFNAPRGREIFERISSKYKDNIPQNYTTSIDSDFHYAGRLDILVDGLFSTMGYEVNDVKLINGVSDHCAIIASIKRL